MVTKTTPHQNEQFLSKCLSSGWCPCRCSFDTRDWIRVIEKIWNYKRYSLSRLSVVGGKREKQQGRTRARKGRFLALVLLRFFSRSPPTTESLEQAIKDTTLWFSGKRVNVIIRSHRVWFKLSMDNVLLIKRISTLAWPSTVRLAIVKILLAESFCCATSTRKNITRI